MAQAIIAFDRRNTHDSTSLNQTTVTSLPFARHSRIAALTAENRRLRLRLAALARGQKTALDALRDTLSERERDLRSILDNMPAMIAYWDKTLHNRFGNHAYLTWFGIDPAIMPGMHIREVIGEERFRLNLPYIEKALQGEAQTFERAIPSPDGQIVRHSLAHYIPDTIDGRVEGFYVLVSDISALKETQRRLQESEERYRAVVEDQTEIICRIRPDGSFTFVNEVYCRFFGKSEDELLNTFWRPTAHPDDLALIDRELGRLSPQQPLVQIENRVFSADGSVHWMQFVSRGFFDECGQLQEIQSVGRDITARKQAELALQEVNGHLEQRIGQRTAELRQMAVATTLVEERERQNIARDLHDDLGQILHVIKLKLEILSQQQAAGKQPAWQEIDALLNAASQQVRSLISQLNPPILANLGLAAALRWLSEEMSRTYALTVTLVLDDRPCPLAKTQAALLFRIARELLINVSKHAGSPRAWLTLSQAPDALHLSVADDGKGIAGPCSEFTASQRGFGLQNMRERILFLGGRMEIANRPQGGLLVSITLPTGAEQLHEAGTA